VDKEKDEARGLTARDEARLKELYAECNQLRSGVKDDLLDLYDRVLKARKTAIAEAREQRCTACFVLLRPQKWNEIKEETQIFTCDSCGRILFYDPAHEPPPPPPDPKKKKKAKAAEPEAVTEEPSHSPDVPAAEPAEAPISADSQ
jgi:RNase P subunit RPR2